MKNKVFLGFDFGLKRIGVAVGQDVTKSATPIQTINAKNGEPEWDAIENLIEKWHPDALIVGIPLDMDGAELSVTAKARKFANQLRERFNLEVYEEDERLTTKAARAEIYEAGGYKALQSREIDAVAAKLILETWLHKSCG